MTLSEKISQLVVNDYFTPNIKAEVILDTLLTPYVAELINQLNRHRRLETVFVTKEMSVKEAQKQSEHPRYGNMGTKIDYILADREYVYLVELKTTNGSIYPKQAAKYLRNCRGKTFGEVFGDKLLTIVSEKTGVGLEDAKAKEEQLYSLFEKICGGVQGDSYAQRSQKLLKARPNWRSTYKYLYTSGQLLDYLYEKDGRQKASIWDKDLKLYYIMPSEGLPHPDFERHGDFYLGSISLAKAGNFLAKKTGDELAQLLANIIAEIDGG